MNKLISILIVSLLALGAAGCASPGASPNAEDPTRTETAAIASAEPATEVLALDKYDSFPNDAAYAAAVLDDIRAASEKEGDAAGIIYKYSTDITLTESVLAEFRHTAEDEATDYARRLDAFLVLYRHGTDDLQKIAQGLLEEADYANNSFWSLIASRSGLSPSKTEYADNSAYSFLLSAASEDDDFFSAEMRRISSCFAIDENDEWLVENDTPPGGYLAQTVYWIITMERQEGETPKYFTDMAKSGICNAFNQSQMYYLVFGNTEEIDADLKKVLDDMCSSVFPDINTGFLKGSGWDWLLSFKINLSEDILRKSMNCNEEGGTLKYYCVFCHHWDKEAYGLPLTPYTTLLALSGIPGNYISGAAEEADRLVVCDVTYQESRQYYIDGFGDAVSSGYTTNVRIYIQNCHTGETEEAGELSFNPPASFKAYAPPKYVFGEMDYGEITDCIAEYFRISTA